MNKIVLATRRKFSGRVYLVLIGLGLLTSILSIPLNRSFQAAFVNAPPIPASSTAILVVIQGLVLSVIFGGLGLIVRRSNRTGHAVCGALGATTASPRTLLLNGIAGLVFGWLYWSYGLESSMLAHFFTGVVLYALVPLVTTPQGVPMTVVAAGFAVGFVAVFLAWAVRRLRLVATDR